MVFSLPPNCSGVKRQSRKGVQQISAHLFFGLVCFFFELGLAPAIPVASLAPALPHPSMELRSLPKIGLNLELGICSGWIGHT